MIELYESGSIAETQDAVCGDLAKSIKDWMGSADSEELMFATITEIMPPNPLIKREHEVTLRYCLKPFTAHAGLTEPGTRWAAMVHHEDGLYAWDVSGLEIVSLQINEDGEIILPKKFEEWQVLYIVKEYAGVINPDYRTKPTENEITVCRILLEDALTTITEAEIARP
jgi:hypothetical protein